eukprot:4513489-Karenia_brevis.AAC.1
MAEGGRRLCIRMDRLLARSPTLSCGDFGAAYGVVKDLDARTCHKESRTGSSADRGPWKTW